MKKQVTLAQEYVKGIWDQNPVFKAALGLCPVLAVTVSAINGIAMALATTFVLTSASLIISSIRKLIPTQVRIASYILIIATFVTIVDLVMKAQFPELSKALGPYIPLIVVNCLILGRQEAFSSKNSVGRSVLDALGMGTGFLIALFVLGSLRELFGSGTILGVQLMPGFYEPWLVMILPAGAFLTLGLLFGAANSYLQKKERTEKNFLIDKYLKAKKEAEETGEVK
ncbi:MAG: electron transport complex subunit E [Melioribacteraceae bacterium]|nr:electron transport complex subunit E [Melioribacteraceae bacterium]